MNDWRWIVVRSPVVVSYATVPGAKQIELTEDEVCDLVLLVTHNITSKRASLRDKLIDILPKGETDVASASQSEAQ